jgi:hypothetical protein
MLPLFTVLIALSSALSAFAQKPVDATPEFKLQQADLFEQKYAKLLLDKKNNKDISQSCSENSARAEAAKVLSYLKSLDASPLTEGQRCHQKRLESKVHGVLAALFKDGAEGKTMFKVMKQNMNDAKLSKCPEIMLSYVRTVADFTHMQMRGLVMMRLGVDLDAEVKNALVQIEILRTTPGGISQADYSSFIGYLRKYK